MDPFLICGYFLKACFLYPIIQKTYMEQMRIEPDALVEIEYEAKNIPEHVRVLRPVVFREADMYCCILGPDPRTGIFGVGPTPTESLRDWEQRLEERLSATTEDDEIAQEILAQLKARKEDVW